MIEYLTRDELLDEVNTRINKSGSIEKLGKQLKIKPEILAAIAAGDRWIDVETIRKLGYKEMVMFTKIEVD